jgi:uncharacterized integral membrane protein
MQFLKTLFWALLVVIITVFAIGNWQTVPIHLWAGLVADVNLPLLLVLTFLAGLFPVLLYHHAIKWRLTSKLTSAERTIADIRGAAVPTLTSTDPGDAATDLTPAPGAVPTAVPPGVA